MDLGLKGKTALVTGASRGIGFATAMALAAEGCNVHLAARSAPDLDAAKAAIGRGHAVELTCHPCDLAAADSARRLAATCGELDILVNNAGAIPGGRLSAIDDVAWRKAWDLKMFGYINLTREVYQRMCDRGSGVIVNVIGLAGERPTAGYIAGATANAGLMAFTRGLGGESPDYGVRVLGLNPGMIQTERLTRLMMDQAQTELGDRNRWEEIQARMTAKLPFGRAGTPAEIGEVVAFLASERASYMSGTIVTVDGGRSIRS